jgi:hypothetical protein
MSNYELSLTASEIDIALQKANSPDTSPLATNNLVTSGGVKTYVDNAIASLDTTVGATVDTISVPPQLNIRKLLREVDIGNEENPNIIGTDYVYNDHYYTLPFTHGQITVRWKYNMVKTDISDPYAVTLNIYDTYGVRITNNNNQITDTGTFPSSPTLITRTFTGSFGDITTLGNGSLYIVADGLIDDIQILEGLPNTVL